MNRRIEAKVRRLPRAPGCYLFKDRRGAVLYVGKAQDLRKRVVAYLRPGGDGRPLIRFLEAEAEDLDFVATTTEQEALLLENTLIKKFRPKHNLRLRDDKNFLLLRLDPKEEWPWFRLVRRRKGDGALYFGPFGSAKAVRRTLALLHRVLPLRDCTDAVFRNRSRPCLKHQIGRCPAPCVGLVGREEYLRTVERACAVLRGDTKECEADLRRRMTEAAEALRFEVAQTAKEHLQALALITERQRVVGDIEDRDVIGLHLDGDEALIAVLKYREGGLEDGVTHRFRTGLPPSELLSAFLTQLYQGDRYVPKSILLPLEPVDRETIEDWLSGKRGARVRLSVPRRGARKEAVEMATRNARLTAEMRARGGGKAEREAEALRKLVGLPAPPRRIHAFDVSTIQGRSTVASRVSFVDGNPCKAEYRRFRIRGGGGREDFASMRQAVERSLALCLEGGGAEELPDLCLIDGGRGQVSAALEALKACGLDPETLPVLGLAKERGEKGERIFLPSDPRAIPLERGAPETLLVTRIRDEAHRFAVTYHRKLRDRPDSTLDGVPGLGPVRKRDLLRAFGSLRGIRKASLEELEEKLPRKVARALFAKLHDPGRGNPET